MVSVLGISFSSLAGAYRQPIGSDTLSFYGSQTLNVTLRPRLEVMILGDVATSAAPSPALPRSRVGTIIAGGTDFVEATCDGGTTASIALCRVVCVSPAWGAHASMLTTSSSLSS
jgi:hypothetical protein